MQTYKQSSLMFLLSKLIYSRSADEYQTNYKTMQNEFPNFMTYFDNNWHNCQEMWVHYFRSSTNDLGNNTNNRLESHNQKIKQYIKQNSHLSVSVKNYPVLSKTHSHLSHLNKFHNIKTKLDKVNRDPVHDMMLNSCVMT